MSEVKKIVVQTTKSPKDAVTKVIIDDKTGPVIVIDPGHGYTSGDTGASAKIYTYNVKGSDGQLTGKTETKNITELPQHVIDNVSLITSSKADNNRTERDLVFDVAVKLKDLLGKEGYTVLLTRDKTVIDGVDGIPTRKARVNLANDNKADYFISIHADGADGFTATGSHTIYHSDGDKDIITASKELATDILSSYKVVAVRSSSPVGRDNIQVLRDANETKRKVLVELGFITTPKDVRAMLANKDKMAEQLKEGLIKNINKHFKGEEK